MDTISETDMLLLAALWKSSHRTGDEGDEARLAKLVETHQQGCWNPTLSARDAAALMALMPVVERMQADSARVPVPEALAAAVERYFRAEKAAKGRVSLGDALILRLREGMELVSASLSGMQPVLAPALATRRSATTQKVSMREEVVSGGVIEYDVLASGENTVMVSVVYRDLQGPLTIRLSDNGRPVSSQTIRETSGRINFDGLAAGEYRLDLTGCCDRSFTLQLLGPTE